MRYLPMKLQPMNTHGLETKGPGVLLLLSITKSRYHTNYKVAGIIKVVCKNVDWFDLKFVYFTVKKNLQLRNIEQNTGKR